MGSNAPNQVYLKHRTSYSTVILKSAEHEREAFRSKKDFVFTLKRVSCDLKQILVLSRFASGKVLSFAAFHVTGQSAAARPVKKESFLRNSLF